MTTTAGIAAPSEKDEADKIRGAVSEAECAARELKDRLMNARGKQRALLAQIRITRDFQAALRHEVQELQSASLKLGEAIRSRQVEIRLREFEFSSRS